MQYKVFNNMLLNRAQKPHTNITIILDTYKCTITNS